MNKFSFIQTGDWHLGRRFHRFETALADRLRQARRDCILTCARTAKTRGAAHILVAGDVFDVRDVASETWREALTLMARDPDIVWHVIPGNHDYYQRGDIWDALVKAASDNVRIHLRPEAVEIASDVYLLPAPMTSRAQSADPTAWMATADTRAGALRIGLAHGSIEGTGGAETTAVPISRNAAADARLDYLALGDWHGVTEVNARTWYAGTPEPLGFKDNGAGYVLAVSVEAGSAPRVEQVRTARHAWVAETFSNVPDDAIAKLMTRVEALGPEARDAIVRLRAYGVLTPDADATMRSAVANIRALVMHAILDDADAELGLTEAEIAELEVDPALKPVMARLSAMRSASEHDPSARAANDALRLLQAYAAEATDRSTGG